MPEKILHTSVEKVIAENQYRMKITTKFHSKDPNGLRTIRIEYVDNMPHRLGAWYAGTVTEQQVTGVKKLLRTVIPEHRVA